MLPFAFAGKAMQSTCRQLQASQERGREGTTSGGNQVGWEVREGPEIAGKAEHRQVSAVRAGPGKDRKG